MNVLKGDVNENDVAMIFLNLSRMLHVHYGMAPMIIIDEYDTPIQQGYIRGYHDKAVDYMRTLFSGGLKDNPHLSYGFLTGILRVANETFYHGLILGLCAMMDNRYHITSNREAGNGRFDVQMLPINKKLPGILIEWKAGKDSKEEALNQLAVTALDQIDDRMYYTEMKAQGVKEVLKYGIAFAGKKVSIKAKISSV